MDSDVEKFCKVYHLIESPGSAPAKWIEYYRVFDEQEWQAEPESELVIQMRAKEVREIKFFCGTRLLATTYKDPSRFDDFTITTWKCTDK